MLDEDAVGDLAGDAELRLREARLDDDEPPNMAKLCVAMTGHPFWWSRVGPESCLARVNDERRVVVRRGVPPARARFLIGHELGHLHHLLVGYRGEDLEERCDAFAAALVAPRRAVRAATKRHAHRVSQLAEALKVTQACALLRLGEVDRRPVLLLRRPPIARGAAFAWPDSLRRAVSAPPEGTHPVRLSDERRWGLMAA